jgi:protein-tyrosine phosphatase
MSDLSIVPGSLVEADEWDGLDWDNVEWDHNLNAYVHVSGSTDHRDPVDAPSRDPAEATISVPDILTSTSMPIDLDWLPITGTGGKVGLTYAPGKQAWCVSGRPNAYWCRSLKDDLELLHGEYGIKAIVSLLEDHEYPELHIERYVPEAVAAGMIVMRVPIPDMGVPKDVDAIRRAVETILSMRTAGHNVAIHCRGGHGRAGTIGACVLVHSGMDVTTAIDTVRSVRDERCVATRAQEDFVWAFAGKTRPVEPSVVPLVPTVVPRPVIPSDASPPKAPEIPKELRRYVQRAVSLARVPAVALDNVHAEIDENLVKWMDAVIEGGATSGNS